MFYFLFFFIPINKITIETILVIYSEDNWITRYSQMPSYYPLHSIHTKEPVNVNFYLYLYSYLHVYCAYLCVHLFIYDRFAIYCSTILLLVVVMLLMPTLMTLFSTKKKENHSHQTLTSPVKMPVYIRVCVYVCLRKG